MECTDVLSTTQVTYQKCLGYCDALCECPIHSKVLWRVGKRPGLCRLTSAQYSIGSNIREFSMNSTRWVLEAMCCLFLHIFYQIDPSTYVMVDSRHSKLVNVVTELPQGIVLGPLLFLRTPRYFFHIGE